jgi:hypothetical protein
VTRSVWDKISCWKSHEWAPNIDFNVGVESILKLPENS